MFIRKEISKEIKNKIFKWDLDKMLNPLLDVEDLESLTIIENKEILYSNDIYLPFKTELIDLHLDYENCFNSHYIFRSELGIKLKKEQLEFNRKVKEKLDNSSDTTKELMRLLRVNSSQAALVGGCVRDSILGEDPKDFDFVTDSHYDEIELLLKNNGFKIKEAGKQFLVMIVSKNGEDFEIAMFRKDGNYKDGRRPESVEVGNIFDDAKRRDFTINSLSFNLTREEVQDPNGSGLVDIRDKILRFVGKPEDRIKEDFLRVARFYRFLGRLKNVGMKPDIKSLKACRSNFGLMQEKVTPERLKNEIEKMVGLQC